MTEATMDRRLTFRELKGKGVRESRMTIWRRIKEGTFPKPIVDHRRVYWLESEIDAHVAELVNLPRGFCEPPSTGIEKLPAGTTLKEALDITFEQFLCKLNEESHDDD
jgi:predicted DNA-binding transcriptional regulator AlpA